MYRIWAFCNALWYWMGDKTKENPTGKNDHVVNITNGLSLLSPTDQNALFFSKMRYRLLLSNMLLIHTLIVSSSGWKKNLFPNLPHVATELTYPIWTRYLSDRENTREIHGCELESHHVRGILYGSSHSIVTAKNVTPHVEDINEKFQGVE